MKDFLQDLIDHTIGLDTVDLLKIVGTPASTAITAVADNKTVVLDGSFAKPIKEFEGTFGMPNLSKLKTILSFDEYDAESKIEVISETKNNVSQIRSFHFETKTGDFINDYRLMNKELVDEKIKSMRYTGTSWQVEIVPTIASIQRMKKQVSANSEELNFTTYTSGKDLVFAFGDVSTHSGNFVFASNITGSLARKLKWPIKTFLTIMDLTGEKNIKIADNGMIKVTVDSGIAVYNYFIPSQSK